MIQQANTNRSSLVRRSTSLLVLQLRQVGTRGDHRDYSLFNGQMIGFPGSWCSHELKNVGWSYVFRFSWIEEIETRHCTRRNKQAKNRAHLQSSYTSAEFQCLQTRTIYCQDDSDLLQLMKSLDFLLKHHKSLYS